MLKVRKVSGVLAKFDKDKIIKTCMNAGASHSISSKIAAEIRKEAYDAIPTEEIRSRVYSKLKLIDPVVAEHYVYRSNMRVRTSRASLDRFDSSRIVTSLVEETKVDPSFANSIAREVEKELGRMKLNYVTAPLIREIVNVKLLEHGMESVRARYTRLGMPIYDVRKLIEEGSSEIVQYSPEAIYRVMANQITREYSLINVLPVDLADAHMGGQIHIHDLNHYSLRPVTFSHDLRLFLARGVRVDGTGEFTAVSGPAKHPASAFMHAIKVMIAGQTECSREQIVEHINFILAPYVRGLDYASVKQLVQMFLFELYQTSAGRGGNAVYSSVSLDFSIPESLKGSPAVQPGGLVRKSVRYDEFSEEAGLLLKAFAEVSSEGDFIGKPFFYPRIEFNLSGRESASELEGVSALAWKFGLPYFTVRRNPFYGIRRGILQYVTINLPQVGYKSNGNLFELLENRLKKAREVLLLKKKIISRNIDNNLLPFLNQRFSGSRYLNPSKQYYVVSYSGLSELVRQQTGRDLTDKSSLSLGMKIVRFMQKTVDEFSGEGGIRFLLSAVPKGLCSYRFAQLDYDRFNGKAVVNGSGESAYYTPSHQVNCSSMLDLGKRLSIEGRLNAIVNGGSLTSVRLDSDALKEDSSKLFSKLLSSRVNQFTFTRDFVLCLKCGYMSYHTSKSCRRCRSNSVRVWSRSTGNYQDLRGWSSGQKQELRDSVRYDCTGEPFRLSAQELKCLV
ncbi:MAG: ATP cone domain-containing protein [Candidatus Altiarchaeota archaeon]|nr:ATP cone domain-containing protein [Candidatus Altiarchaeota archaeon]